MPDQTRGHRGDGAMSSDGDETDGDATDRSFAARHLTSSQTRLAQIDWPDLMADQT
jgi:hypothetical protein